MHAWLQHPLTRGLAIDDPRTTELRRRIIEEKPFLKRIYGEWYQAIARELPVGTEPVLELGSGAGFMGEYIPNLITSEVFLCSRLDVVLDARTLPFAPQSLRAIVMTDVLHHIPDVRAFFVGAARCVAHGGAIIMVEPWNTNWSRLIYQHLHHEPFLPEQVSWELDAAGPLSGANGALSWMLFERDRAKFEQEFPNWRVSKIEIGMPFRYLVSGGVSLRNLMPEQTYPIWSAVENAMHPWMKHWGMFAQVIISHNYKNYEQY